MVSNTLTGVLLSFFCLFGLILIWFGSDISDIIRSWVEGRNKRLAKEQDHKQEMEKLAAKKELLLLDPDYEKEFERKLRVAIKSNQKILSELEDDDITYNEKSQMRR